MCVFLSGKLVTRAIRFSFFFIYRRNLQHITPPKPGRRMLHTNVCVCACVCATRARLLLQPAPSHCRRGPAEAPAPTAAVLPGRNTTTTLAP